MGGKIERVGNPAKKQETLLEAEKRDNIPRGLFLYIGEQIGNALNGKGTKDPMKIISNGFKNYSESPSYKVVKRNIKRIVKGGCKMLLDYSKIPVREELMPLYTGEGLFDMNSNSIYM